MVSAFRVFGRPLERLRQGVVEAISESSCPVERAGDGNSVIIRIEPASRSAFEGFIPGLWRIGEFRGYPQWERVGD